MNQGFATEDEPRGGRPGTEAARAWTDLCRAYWYPVYAFIRARGTEAAGATALTEVFLEQRELGWCSAQGQGSRRLRAWMLGELQQFLAGPPKVHGAAERTPRVAVDAEEAENRYRFEPAEQSTPERLFERRWTMTVLGLVLDRLRTEAEAEGKEQLFYRLRRYIYRDGKPASYAEIASTCGLAEPEVQTAVARLRIRYRALLSEEISRTLERADDLDDEIRHLISSVGQ